jgi:prepilin-type N-terminal cleavage/methylation domain-containing protein
MTKKNKNVGRSFGGFTLIELLVVIAIIGILASMVIIGLNSTRKLARDSRRIADLRQMQSALELYFNSCSVYPGGPALPPTVAVKCGVGTPPPDPYTAMQGIAGWNITLLPTDPLTQLPYGYCSDPTGSQYTLHSTLEDAGNSVLNNAVGTDNCGGTPGFSCGGSPRVAGSADYCVEL